jgi:carboxylesterase
MGTGTPNPVDVAGGRPSVLALHGFGATPQEAALIVEVARGLGLRALAPLLPGHGTHATDLARTTFDDWSRAALAALNELTTDGSKAIVIGQSLGGVLALHLALRRPEAVLGLGLLATATRLTRFTAEIPLSLVQRANFPDFSVTKVGADIKDPVARASQLTYGTQPIHAAIEVMRAGARVGARLGEIRCPVFIAHGIDDHVCPVSNAYEIHGRVSSQDRTLLILQNSFHIVTRDHDRDLLARELGRFVRRLRDAATA